MPVRNLRSDNRANISDFDLFKHALSHLGGESLEGSGFDHEPPAPQFQFDWTQLDQTLGGLR